MADWPMAGCNPQRTNFQPETLGAGATPTWTGLGSYKFALANPGEKIHPQVEAIVSAGHVLMPSLKGNLYSFAAGAAPTSPERTLNVGAPIMASVAADGTKVYVFDIYGRATAYTLSNGSVAWGPIQVTDTARGFQCAPLLADGKLMIGGTDGIFYALDPASGAIIWQYTIGVPLLQTAAYGVNGSGDGIAVFGAQNMRVYGLFTASGAVTRQAWQSGVLSGIAFKDYYPVIVGSKVLVRPWSKYPDFTQSIATPTPIRAISVSDFLVDAQMVTALSNYVAAPGNYSKTLYVLNLADGTETPASQVIHWNFATTMNGGSPPPCVDASGYIVIPAMRPVSLGTAIGDTGWCRVNLATGKVVDGLIEGVTIKGWQNLDENMCASACNNGIFGTHIQEANAQFTGFYVQASGVWQQLGSQAASTLLYTNTQGGGANPRTISNGYAYHNCHPHTLTVLRAT